MYNIQLSKAQIENILKALMYAEENEILSYDTVGLLHDYFTDEMEYQNRALALAKEGKDIHESMKIQV